MTTTEKLKYILSLLQNDHYSEREKLTIIRKLVKRDDEVQIRLPKYSLDEIRIQVENHTGITIDQMNTEFRKQEVVMARQLAHYKSRMFTVEPIDFIGFYFGRKNHATVIHSTKLIEGFLKFDRLFREKHEQFLNN